MVFALEEINHSTMLLPGIKLGYHIFDSCGRPPWALQSALSLVGGDNTSCNSTNPPDYSSGHGEEIKDSRGNSFIDQKTYKKSVSNFAFYFFYSCYKMLFN